MNISVNNPNRSYPVFQSRSPCGKIDNVLRLLKTPLSEDTVSFCKLPIHTLKDFSFKLKLKYGECSIEDVIIKNCKNENLLGAGSEGKVFRIEPMDDYVVKVNHPIETSMMNLPDNKLVSVVDKFPHNNFGQPIATNQNGVFLLKKVNGTPNNIENYRNCVRNGELISIGQFKPFIENLKIISMFPQKSFNKFLSDVKIMNENSDYLIDVWGIDNLIFDSKNKRLNVIDLSERYTRLFKNRVKENSVDDVISLILAPMIHLDALRKLDPKDQNELKKISQLIIKKLIISGKEVGLNRNPKEAAIRFEVFDEFHKEKKCLTEPDKLQKFIEFQDFYGLNK